MNHYQPAYNNSNNVQLNQPPVYTTHTASNTSFSTNTTTTTTATNTKVHHPQPHPNTTTTTNPTSTSTPETRLATRYSLGLRIQALTLRAHGVPINQIEKITGMPRRSQLNIWNKAKAGGFDPAKDPRIFERYVVDGMKSGRPRKVRSEDGGALGDGVRGREGEGEVVASHRDDEDDGDRGEGPDDSSGEAT